MNLLKTYLVFVSLLVSSVGVAQEQKDSENKSPEKKEALKEAVETTNSEKRDSVFIPNKVMNKTVSDTVHPKDREYHSIGSDLIDIRCWNVPAPIEAYITIPVIIDHNQNDIRKFLFGCYRLLL